jgi:hypothetical protein
MSVKIDISTGSYPMTEHPTVDEVLSARIREQEEILNALEEEKTKAIEKRELLVSITKEATSRSSGACIEESRGGR